MGVDCVRFLACSLLAGYYWVIHTLIVCFFVKSEMFGGERGEIFGKCKNICKGEINFVAMSSIMSPMIVLLDNIFIIRKLQLGNNLLPKFLLFFENKFIFVKSCQFQVVISQRILKFIRL